MGVSDEQVDEGVPYLIPIMTETVEGTAGKLTLNS